MMAEVNPEAMTAVASGLIGGMKSVAERVL